MSLVEQLHGLDLAMGSRYAPREQAVLDDDGKPTDETITVVRFVSWTADEAKAPAAREAGATVVEYRSRDPRFSGWEVTVNEAVA